MIQRGRAWFILAHANKNKWKRQPATQHPKMLKFNIDDGFKPTNDEDGR